MIAAQIGLVDLEVASRCRQLAEMLLEVEPCRLERVEVEAPELEESVVLRRPPGVGDFSQEVFDPEMKSLVHLVDVWRARHPLRHLQNQGVAAHELVLTLGRLLQLLGHGVMILLQGYNVN